ncbi:hypothetical protein TGARI_260380 [Toxoplasma gondii ARI]|uniref:Uncharacterized protein n=1 Tax=Toxoplasma gondii ARI TaxID=1074872 RepID=A0A139XRX1_TOXGO|nr:hypothetical protein TGARI_260380 [Toxoplasma gondii ARI]
MPAFSSIRASALSGASTKSVSPGEIVTGSPGEAQTPARSTSIDSSPGSLSREADGKGTASSPSSAAGSLRKYSEPTSDNHAESGVASCGASTIHDSVGAGGLTPSSAQSGIAHLRARFSSLPATSGGNGFPSVASTLATRCIKSNSVTVATGSASTVLVAEPLPAALRPRKKWTPPPVQCKTVETPLAAAQISGAFPPHLPLPAGHRLDAEGRLVPETVTLFVKKDGERTGFPKLITRPTAHFARPVPLCRLVGINETVIMKKGLMAVLLIDGIGSLALCMRAAMTAEQWSECGASLDAKREVEELEELPERVKNRQTVRKLIVGEMSLRQLLPIDVSTVETDMQLLSMRQLLMFRIKNCYTFDSASLHHAAHSSLLHTLDRRLAGLLGEWILQRTIFGLFKRHVLHHAGECLKRACEKKNVDTPPKTSRFTSKWPGKRELSAAQAFKAVMRRLTLAKTEEPTYTPGTTAVPPASTQAILRGRKAPTPPQADTKVASCVPDVGDSGDLSSKVEKCPQTKKRWIGTSFFSAMRRATERPAVAAVGAARLSRATTLPNLRRQPSKGALAATVAARRAQRRHWRRSFDDNMVHACASRQQAMLVERASLVEVDTDPGKDREEKKPENDGLRPTLLNSIKARESNAPAKSATREAEYREQQRRESADSLASKMVEQAFLAGGLIHYLPSEYAMPGRVDEATGSQKRELGRQLVLQLGLMLAAKDRRRKLFACMEELDTIVNGRAGNDGKFHRPTRTTGSGNREAAIAGMQNGSPGTQQAPSTLTSKEKGMRRQKSVAFPGLPEEDGSRDERQQSGGKNGDVGETDGNAGAALTPQRSEERARIFTGLSQLEHDRGSVLEVERNPEGMWIRLLVSANVAAELANINSVSPIKSSTSPGQKPKATRGASTGSGVGFGRVRRSTSRFLSGKKNGRKTIGATAAESSLDAAIQRSLHFERLKLELQRNPRAGWCECFLLIRPLVPGLYASGDPDEANTFSDRLRRAGLKWTCSTTCLAESASVRTAGEGEYEVIVSDDRPVGAGVFWGMQAGEAFWQRPGSDAGLWEVSLLRDQVPLDMHVGGDVRVKNLMKELTECLNRRNQEKALEAGMDSERG